MWNSLVAAVRAITPHGKLLKRRPNSLRQFDPPSQLEFSALLAECDAAAPRSCAGLVVRFLAMTGTRIHEARSLQWEHVKPAYILIPGIMSKNGKSRSVPILPGLAGVLDQLRSLDSAGYVLPRQSPRKAIATACKRAGLAPMSFHCFRHLFATRCLESGVDVPTVARWLGHSDGGALLSKTYFHLLDDHSRQMAARVQIAA